MHAFISFCILISCCIHTTLTRPLHLHLLNFRNAGAGGTLLKAMKVEKSLLEVPRWQRFCWNSVLIGSWKLWKLNEAEGRWRIYFVLWWDSECYIHLYIDVYIDTLDGDKIIPHDARQIILRAFFIWRSMMSFHYPLISLDNFCISGGGVCWGFTTRGVAFLNRGITLYENFDADFPVRTMHSTGAVKHGTDSSSNRQRGVASGENGRQRIAVAETRFLHSGPTPLIMGESLAQKGKNTAGIGYC